MSLTETAAAALAGPFRADVFVSAYTQEVYGKCTPLTRMVLSLGYQLAPESPFSSHTISQLKDRLHGIAQIKTLVDAVESPRESKPAVDMGASERLGNLKDVAEGMRRMKMKDQKEVAAEGAALSAEESKHICEKVKMLNYISDVTYDGDFTLTLHDGQQKKLTHPQLIEYIREIWQMMVSSKNVDSAITKTVQNLQNFWFVDSAAFTGETVDIKFQWGESVSLKVDGEFQRWVMTYNL